MSVNNKVSSGVAPNAHKEPQDLGGSSNQAEAEYLLRRNSFDFVIDMANARAAEENTVVSSGQASSSGINTTDSPWPPRGSSLPKTRRRQPFDVDIEAQKGTFEEIEMQDWPTESRIAAIDSSFAEALTDPTAQLPEGTKRKVNVPSPICLSTTSTRSRGCGFWRKVSDMIGL